MAKKVSKKHIFLLLIIVINLAIIAVAYFSTPTLSYQLNEDEASYSVSDVSPFAISVTVPSHYKDLPVTEIADRAFSYSSWLMRLSFAQDSKLQIIGERAFEGCRALRKVEFAEGLLCIGDGAFANCSKLVSLAIPDSVESIGNYAFADKFYSTMKLAEITFGQESKLESIGAYTFKQCRKLDNLSLPDSVVSIGTGAFLECNSLKHITIPTNTTSIGQAVFSNCSSLESIDVAEGNTAFTSIDGVLFNILEFELRAYPIGNSRTSYTLPEKVRTIRTRAFAGCKALQSVTMPSNIWSIGASAFEDCSNLASITVEKLTPPALEQDALLKVSNDLKIYVPSQSVDAYKNSLAWADWADCIYANP